MPQKQNAEDITDKNPLFKRKGIHRARRRAPLPGVSCEKAGSMLAADDVLWLAVLPPRAALPTRHL